MTKISVFLAQTAAPAGAPGSQWSFFITMGLMFGAFYFLIVAPQNKKRKEHEQMLSNLKAGDEVITAGGIYGVITSVKDDRYTIRIGDNNSKVEVGRSFISSLVKKADAA